MTQLFRTRKILKSRYFPSSLQILATLMLVVGLYYLMTGPQATDRNIGSILMWFFWWPLFVIQYLLIGRFWCSVCPFGALGDLVRKRFGLDLAVPEFVKKYALMIIGVLILVILWAEEVLALQNDPMGTAILLFVIIGLVILVSVIFERRAWCRYMCPLGGMGVVYARVGMLQLRGNPDKCRTCRAVLCAKGTAKVEGCPMAEFPSIKDSNAYCIFCGNCVKVCPKDSAKLEFRLPSKELWVLRKTRLGEAVLTLLLGGVISCIFFMHGFPEVTQGMAERFGRVAGFSLFFVLWQTGFFLVMAVASHVASRLNHMSEKMNFCVFSFALIPLILCAHLGHGLMLLFRGGDLLQRYLEAGFGLEYSLSSYADTGGMALAGVQFLLLAVGLVLSVVAARHIAQSFLARSGRAKLSVVPFNAAFVLFAVLNGWILIHWQLQSAGNREMSAQRMADAALKGASSLHGFWQSPLNVTLFFLALCVFMPLAAWLLRRFFRPGVERRENRGLEEETRRLNVLAEASEIVSVQDELSRFAQSRGVGVKTVFDLNMAIQEMMTYMVITRTNADIIEEDGVDSLRRPLAALGLADRPKRLHLDFVITMNPDSVYLAMEWSGRVEADLRLVLALGLGTGDVGLIRADRQIRFLMRYHKSLKYEHSGGVNHLSLVRELAEGDD